MTEVTLDITAHAALPAEDGQRVDFIKMHGLLNDFIILDARTTALEINPLQVKALANRRSGIGCDQLIILRPTPEADVFMEIWNADGSRVAACGNATRCVADLIARETANHLPSIQTDAGLLNARVTEGQIAVHMGQPEFSWQKIPLQQATDELHVDLELNSLPAASCVSMGNPHAVFFVKNVMSVDLENLGPQVENHWMFPERVNASFVEVRQNALRVRVWERGAGITQACGTAACAALVSACRRGLTGRQTKVMLDGGDLAIKWQEDTGQVVMTGPAAEVFRGSVLITPHMGSGAI